MGNSRYINNSSTNNLWDEILKEKHKLSRIFFFENRYFMKIKNGIVEDVQGEEVNSSYSIRTRSELIDISETPSQDVSSNQIDYTPYVSKFFERVKNQIEHADDIKWVEPEVNSPIPNEEEMRVAWESEMRNVRERLVREWMEKTTIQNRWEILDI